jgi:hypothetical protein
MKTEIENRIQDSEKQDACLCCEGNATPAARPCISQVLSDQADLSDCPSLDETLLNSILSTAPARSHGLIHSRSHALFRVRPPALSRPAKRLDNHQLPIRNQQSGARSRSHALPIAARPRCPRGHVTSIITRRTQDQGVLSNDRSALVPRAETLHGQKVWTFLADSSQPISFGAFEQYTCHEFQINCRSILDLNFCGLDNPQSPIRDQQYSRRDSHALPIAAPLSFKKNLRKFKVAKAYSRLGKVQKMRAGFNVKPRFNLLDPGHRSLDLLSFSAHPAPNVQKLASRLHWPRSRSIQPYLGVSRLKKNSPRSRLNPAITPLVRTSRLPGSTPDLYSSPRSGSTIIDHRFAISNPVLGIPGSRAATGEPIEVFHIVSTAARVLRIVYRTLSTATINLQKRQLLPTVSVMVYPVPTWDTPVRLLDILAVATLFFRKTSDANS